jgi:hypothetical protein
MPPLLVIADEQVMIWAHRYPKLHRANLRHWTNTFHIFPLNITPHTVRHELSPRRTGPPEEVACMKTRVG